MSTYTSFNDRIEEELDMIKPMYQDLRVAARTLATVAERFVELHDLDLEAKVLLEVVKNAREVLKNQQDIIDNYTKA